MVDIPIDEAVRVYVRLGQLLHANNKFLEILLFSLKDKK